MHLSIGGGVVGAGSAVLVLPPAPGPPIAAAGAAGAGGRTTDAAAAEEAFRNAQLTLTTPAGFAGCPQVVLPAGTVDGAPVGLSLVGARGTDEALLALACKLTA